MKVTLLGRLSCTSNTPQIWQCLIFRCKCAYSDTITCHSNGHASTADSHAHSDSSACFSDHIPSNANDCASRYE